MVDPKAGKFINSLVKSLQMLCHGYMDFKDNIEIIGHIYLRIDNSQKFDYIVNEQVSKQGDDSTFFQSNSYHSLPPTKTGRERERAASGRSDDEVVTANHHRLDDTAIGGSRVQIDLSGPIPVTRNSESSPDCFFNAATIASEIRRRSHSRDSQSLAHSLEDEHQRVLASLGVQDHAHNHSNLSGARDLEQGERSASNGADRTGVNSLYHVVKDTDKSRQQDSEDFRGQDGTIIIKAEPGDQNRNAEMMSIPSVSSMLPMAHQSAMLSNTAHTGHAMFAAATMGHHSMFDTSLTTSDMRRSEGHGQARQAGSGQGQRMRTGMFSPSQHRRHSGIDTNHNGPDLQRFAQVGPLSFVPTRRPVQSATSTNIGIGTNAVPRRPTDVQIRCKLCGTMFQNGDLLNLHMQFMHNEAQDTNSFLASDSAAAADTVSGLPICNTSSNSASSNAAHTLGNHQAEGYNASIPPYSDSEGSITLLPSTASTSPQRTLSDSGRVSQGRMWCKYCRKKFVGADGASFAQHVIACKQNASTRCGQCGKTFSSRVAFNDHVDSMHTRKGFRCNACGMVFKWRTYVYQHRRMCNVLRMKKEPS